MKWWGIGFAALACIVSMPQRSMPALEFNSAELCSTVVATLTPRFGDPSETRTGQRVEVRQCPLKNFNPSIGVLQFVAWEANAKVPSLVVDTEVRWLKQLVMIKGAYAFETVNGASSGVIGIIFENGKPRKVVDDSTKGSVVINSDQNSITISLDDGLTPRRTYNLKGK